jgi:hypothetical protein
MATEVATRPASKTITFLLKEVERLLDEYVNARSQGNARIHIGRLAEG